jgi:hypothetical protein
VQAVHVVELGDLELDFLAKVSVAQLDCLSGEGEQVVTAQEEPAE